MYRLRLNIRKKGGTLNLRPYIIFIMPHNLVPLIIYIMPINLVPFIIYIMPLNLVPFIIYIMPINLVPFIIYIMPLNLVPFIIYIMPLNLLPHLFYLPSRNLYLLKNFLLALRRKDLVVVPTPLSVPKMDCFSNNQHHIMMRMTKTEVKRKIQLAEVEKRPRGRPRKIDFFILPDGVAYLCRGDLPKRPRGRPRKTVIPLGGKRDPPD